MNKRLWLLPALASALFLAFSLRVLLTEGALGLVEAHLRNGWTHQITIDLFSCGILGLFCAAPHARKYGINPVPWSILTMLTGAIGFFAYAARILYVRSAAESSQS